MTPFIDLTGQKFERLVVLGRVANTKNGTARWLCRCECGKETTVSQGHLRSGDSRSCGCLRKDSSFSRLLKDITGKVFDRLTVLNLVGKRNRRYRWRCICIYGKETEALGEHLHRGAVVSCGCKRLESQSSQKRRDAAAAAATTHGHCRGGWSPEYTSYMGAKQRCTNPNNTHYANYGCRGIEFRFNSFEEWYAELGERPEPKRLYSVDRIDNDGHYEKGNVRWATKSQQQNNRRVCLERTA